MKTKRIQPWLAPVLTLGLALTLTGCIFSPDKKDEVDEPVVVLQPVSAKNVLQLLIKTYQEKDLVPYTDLFDVNLFTFVFDVTDVEDDPDLTPEWGWPEEFTSTKNMFESELVLEVKLDFVPEPTTDPLESDKVPEEWRKVIITNVQLEIDTIDPLGGENIIYKVSGDRASFFLEIDAEDLIEGLPRWRIVEWRDERVG